MWKQINSEHTKLKNNCVRGGILSQNNQGISKRRTRPEKKDTQDVIGGEKADIKTRSPWANCQQGAQCVGWQGQNLEGQLASQEQSEGQWERNLRKGKRNVSDGLFYLFLFPSLSQQLILRPQMGREEVKGDPSVRVPTARGHRTGAAVPGSPLVSWETLVFRSQVAVLGLAFFCRYLDLFNNIYTYFKFS